MSSMVCFLWNTVISLLIIIYVASSYSLVTVTALTSRLSRARRVPPVSIAKKVPSTPRFLHPAAKEDFTSGEVDHNIDIKADIEHLKQNIVHWLDVEYTPHPIHQLFGKKVATVCTRHLLSGDIDLVTMHQQLQDTLDMIELNGIMIDAEDVADKVCELIIARLDQNEGVVEDKDNSDNDIVANMDECERHLASDFNKYQFVRYCLEGHAPPDMRALAVAVQLGFRLQLGQHGPHLVQDQQLAPSYWEGLSEVPDFANIEDLDIQRRLEADMPEETESVDIVMETLAGQDAYRNMKASTDPETQRRVLIAKWMYVHGLLNDQFPPVKRYVPAHMQQKLDEDSATI